MKKVVCIVETPQNSNIKYDYDVKLGKYTLSKFLPAGLVFPYDFGYIPGTVGEDGDPLDVIIVSEQKTFTGCVLHCRIIGAIKATQTEKNGTKVENDRYVAIPEASTVFKKVTSIKKLEKRVIDELASFFVTYNNEAGKEFKPLQIIKRGQALKEINTSKANIAPTQLVQILIPAGKPSEKRITGPAIRKIQKKLLRKERTYLRFYNSKSDVLIHKKKYKDLKIFEVMTSTVGEKYWKKFKKKIQKKLGIRPVIVRQIEIGFL